MSNNAETWLEGSDLVFIDPPGTGYARMLVEGDEVRKRVWSANSDFEAIAEMVRRWLADHHRMASPKYVMGELRRIPWPARGAHVGDGVGGGRAWLGGGRAWPRIDLPGRGIGVPRLYSGVTPKYPGGLGAVRVHRRWRQYSCAWARTRSCCAARDPLNVRQRPTVAAEHSAVSLPPLPIS